MLRIVALQGVRNGTTLGLEGRIIGPWVDELRHSCEQVRASGGALTLDLAGVDFLGRDGVRLLKELLEDGVAVVNCPAFVTEQIKALSPC